MVFSVQAKYDMAMRHSGKVKIVTPDWVSECIVNGAIVSEENFHPRLLLAQSMETDSTAAEEGEEVQPMTPVPSSPPSSPAAIGPPLLLQGSPKGESSRTKEALAKMVSNRIQQATAKYRESFDYAPPLETEPDPPTENLPQPLVPTPELVLDCPPLPSGEAAPLRARGRGRGSRGSRGSRGARGAVAPRNMLQNITNNGDIMVPGMSRSPRGRRSPRSPRGSGVRGGRKVGE